VFQGRKQGGEYVPSVSDWFRGFCEGKHGGVRKLLRLPKEVSLGLLWRHFISPGLEVSFSVQVCDWLMGVGISLIGTWFAIVLVVLTHRVIQ